MDSSDSDRCWGIATSAGRPPFPREPALLVGVKYTANITPEIPIVRDNGPASADDLAAAFLAVLRSLNDVPMWEPST